MVLRQPGTSILQANLPRMAQRIWLTHCRMLDAYHTLLFNRCRGCYLMTRTGQTALQEGHVLLSAVLVSKLLNLLFSNLRNSVRGCAAGK